MTKYLKHQVESGFALLFTGAVAAAQPDGAACPNTQLPTTTVSAVKQAVFAESNPNGTTVGSTFNKCSYGKSTMTASNSMVADTVTLPCAGTNYGVSWSFNTCNFDDFNGYADAADEALRARGIDLGQYKHKVYLIPPSACGFTGLGYTGCDGTFDCRVWIGAGFWATPQAIAHEIGHNLFLAHAGAATFAGVYDEYADQSCMMGYCCSDRCPNTPHAWQLGWISVRQLDGSSLQPGLTFTTVVASQSASARSGIRILPSWAAGMDPLFLGYRTRAGGDAATDGTVAGKLHIYSAAITNTFDAQTTAWNAALAAGQSWTHPATGLVVRLANAWRGAAKLSICCKAGAETLASCQTGLDNDCNGVLRDLNRGSYGSVVLALDKQTGQEVAIKYIERGAEHITKYEEREIINHMKLRHPHIVELQEVFLTDTQLLPQCLAMEYAAHGDLARYVSSRRGLPEDEARWFFQQMMVALDYCHRMGVSNRDIKLENTLLSTGTQPLIKLADFGKDAGLHSAPSSRVGTPAYLAPEVVGCRPGETYDGMKADIWSCGVLLYSMLTAKIPFRRAGDELLKKNQKLNAMLQRILRGDCAFPADRPLSEGVRRLISHMLDIFAHPWFRQGLRAGALEFNDIIIQDSLAHQLPAEFLDTVRAIVVEAWHVPAGAGADGGGSIQSLDALVRSAAGAHPEGQASWDWVSK
ncbi:hypothetical protein ABPG75_001280 [Micractinium tetrahymenae]